MGWAYARETSGVTLSVGQGESSVCIQGQSCSEIEKQPCNPPWCNPFTPGCVVRRKKCCRQVGDNVIFYCVGCEEDCAGFGNPPGRECGDCPNCIPGIAKNTTCNAECLRSGSGGGL